MTSPDPEKGRILSQQEALHKYLRARGLRRTQQRDTILETLLRSGRHMNLDELIRQVRRTDRTIGPATVYRTVNILLDCGLAQEVRLGDDIRRIEPLQTDEHHDHLICVRCGLTAEFFNCTLEVAQVIAANKYGFKPLRHSLKIYGICSRCQEEKEKPAE